MRRDEADDQPDPSEIQPTDNSTGTPVDLERLDDLPDAEPVDQEP